MNSCLNNRTSQYEIYLNEIQFPQWEHESVEKRNQKQNNPPMAFWCGGILIMLSNLSSSPVAGCGGKRNSRKNTESRGPGWTGKVLIGFARSGWDTEKWVWTGTPPKYRERREKRWEIHMAVAYDSLQRCGAQSAATWPPPCSSVTTMIDPGKSVGGVTRVFIVLRKKMTRKSI